MRGVDDNGREWFVEEGDHKQHKYKFIGNIQLCSGMSLDIEGEELIETEVHWLVKLKNGYDFHTPKGFYQKVT